MGNSSWACFACRTAVRRDTAFAGEVCCPTCGQPCTNLGYKIPIPPKGKDRLWSALREQLVAQRRRKALDVDQSAVRNRHAVEQEIARLRALPTNEGRAKAIRLLEKRLSTSRD